MNHSKKVNDAVNWIFVSFKIFFITKLIFFLPLSYLCPETLAPGGRGLYAIPFVSGGCRNGRIPSYFPDAPGIRGTVTLHLLKQNMIDVCLPCRFHWRHRCTFILAIPSHTSSAPSPSRVGFIRPAEWMMGFGRAVLWRLLWEDAHCFWAWSWDSARGWMWSSTCPSAFGSSFSFELIWAFATSLMSVEPAQLHFIPSSSHPDTPWQF